MNALSRNAIFLLYPTAEELLRAPNKDVEQVLLRHVINYCKDQMQRMVGRETVSTGLFEKGGYAYSVQSRTDVTRVINRAWKALEDAGFIEEPDSTNGKNGYRVPSSVGIEANSLADSEGARIRTKFTRDMFHPSLPTSAWNAFTSGDYDTAVFEAFKSVEVAVRTKGKFPDTDFGVTLMKKAFDPATGPLRNAAAQPGRQKARCELFTGAFGEIRNPKGHSDPTITDPIIAVEELMTAGTLRRIVDAA